MKPFKIGIWIDEHMYPNLGGALSYTQKLINKIDAEKFNDQLEIIFVGFNLDKKFDKPVISIPFKENYLNKKRNNVLHKIFGIKLERKDLPKNYASAISILKDQNIQLIFYLTPQVQINNFPYIITNWDLAHKSTFAFPEFSMNGQFDYREKYFSKILNEALLICCESDQGKLEIEHAYAIEPCKIKILPMFAGSIIDDEVTTIKPNWVDEGSSFFLYPAQFWPHKNHFNLVIAFKDFLATHPNFRLILTGSDKGNLPYIDEVIIDNGMSSNIIIAGFVENSILKWLYKNAKGLIFPSFLGPTNMPLLEAQYFGCPIACSNLKGHKALLSNEAIYFEPTDVAAIKKSMDFLAETNKLENNVKNIQVADGLKLLENIFIESMAIRKSWGQFDKIS